MNKRLINMKKLKELLRLKFQVELSNRQIAKSTNTSASTVSYYARAAAEVGINWEALVNMHEDELVKLLKPHCNQIRGKGTKYTKLNFQEIHNQMQHKHVTLQLLWEEYIENTAVSAASNVCDGDVLGKVAKDLLREYTFKSLAIQALSAGVMQHLGDKLVLAKSSATGAPQFSQDLLHNTVKAGVDAGLETAAYGGSFADRLGDNLKSAGLDAVISASMAPINQQYDKGEVSHAKQLAIHAVLGATKGVILKGYDGIFEGAVAGVIRAEGDNWQRKRQEEQERSIKASFVQKGFETKPDGEKPVAKMGDQIIEEGSLSEFDYDTLDRIANNYGLEISPKLETDFSSKANSGAYGGLFFSSSNSWHNDWSNPTAGDLALTSEQATKHDKLKDIAKFTTGAVHGIATNTAVSSLIGLSSLGRMFAGVSTYVAGAAAWFYGSSKVYEFETSNFHLTEEYRELLNNPFIPDEKKQQIIDQSQVKHETYVKSIQGKNPVQVTKDYVVREYREDPYGLGKNLMLFLGVTAPVKGRVKLPGLDKERARNNFNISKSDVVEHTPKTGQIRSWNECYDHKGNVNRVHPKMLDGQDLTGQHYPPTKTELEAFLKSEAPKP